MVNQPKKYHPLDIINRAKDRGIQDVIVSYSCGKQSIVVLDLCMKHFRRVEAFHMYWVADLEFREEPLRAAERRYGIKIVRVPDFRTAKHIKHASWRHPTADSQKLPSLSLRQLEMSIRFDHFSGEIMWIASGESVCESVQRVGMIRGCKDLEGNSCPGIDYPRGHIYPIGEWNVNDCLAYMSQNDLTLPPEYDVLGTGASFGGLRMEHIATVKRAWPSDYAKIKRMFPLIDAQVVRWEEENRREVKHNDTANQVPSV